MGVEKAAILAGTDPDYGIKDLYQSIVDGNYVSVVSVNENRFLRVCAFNWAAILVPLHSSDDF